MNDELVDYLSRAATAVHIAMERDAAADLGPRLKDAAATIAKLSTEVEQRMVERMKDRREIELLQAALAELRSDFGRIADIAGQHNSQAKSVRTLMDQGER